MNIWIGVAVVVVVVGALCWRRRRSRSELSDFEDRLHEVGHGRVNAKITIEYLDASSKTTTRPVKVRRALADHDGGIYLRGHCYMRNASRTFRVDRIKSFIDDDGVVIDHRDFLSDRLGIKLWSRALRAKASPRSRHKDL